MMMALAAAALLAAGTPGTAAEATGPEEDCRDYCGEKAAERCDDVTSSWCNAYIVGCLAGCGVSHPC